MKLRNDRSLSQQDIDTIVAWVKAGARRAATRPTCPPAPTFATGWQLGEPDFVFEQPIEWTVQARRRRSRISTSTRRSRSPRTSWPRAVEIRPSNFSVVHHSGVYIVDIPDGYTVKDGYLYDEKGKQIPPTRADGQEGQLG